LQALADPELQAEAKKLDVTIEPFDGPQVQAEILSALQQSPENIELLAQSFHAGQ
jgi:hypothetical protein